MVDGTWVERLLREIRLPRWAGSVVIGSLFSLPYLFFSSPGQPLPRDPFTIQIALTMFLFMVIQLAGIPYFVSHMKSVFHEYISLESLKEMNPYSKFEDRLYHSPYRYAITLLVLLPFILINISQILAQGLPFYNLNGTLVNLLLDLYNYIIGYFLLLLLALNLWIIFAFTWTLAEIRKQPYRWFIQIDILAADNLGGLKPLRSFILQMLTFYLVATALLIWSYLLPGVLFSYEAIFAIVLLIIGLFFLGFGIGTIRMLVRGKIGECINKINLNIRNQEKKLISPDRTEGERVVPEGIGKIKSMLDVFYGERERMLDLCAKSRGYDLRTVIQSAISFTMPIIAFSEKMFSVIEKLWKF